MKTTNFLSRIVLFFAILLFVNHSIQAQDKNETAIRKVLNQQEIAWNKGDLEAFMKGYWKSENLRFIGSRGVSYGWETTLKNYQLSYPDKESMGILTFEIISIEKLSEEYYFVIGKWQLERKKNSLGGHFSLLWKEIEGKWRIIADHSS